MRARVAAWRAENGALSGDANLAARLELLPLGVGVHHAGLLPLFKTLVEELFNDGLLKVV